MLLLPNGCKCSNPSVYPKNWQDQDADVLQNWFIHFRFYTPGNPKAKQVILKGMNRYKEVKQRQRVTSTVLKGVLFSLHNGTFNAGGGKGPFALENLKKGITRDTPLIEALQGVFEKLEVADSTRSDIRSVLAGVKSSSTRLGLNNIPICQVQRRHIKQVLFGCKGVVKGWSENRFNKYRAYLKILFNELLEHDALDIDPMAGITKQKTFRKIRTILTPEERSTINVHLKEKHYTFWRFMQVFFHSGARERELMLVKAEDVDLVQQRYKVVIKKGRSYRESWKVIKNIALYLWKEILSEAKPGEFLFSNGLKPGPLAINAAQITRRWRKHVKSPLEKGGMGIAADFYSLKHLHTTEVVNLLSNLEAAIHNSHTSTQMVNSTYDIMYKERIENKIMRLTNSFDMQ